MIKSLTNLFAAKNNRSYLKRFMSSNNDDKKQNKLNKLTTAPINRKKPTNNKKEKKTEETELDELINKKNSTNSSELKLKDSSIVNNEISNPNTINFQNEGDIKLNNRYKEKDQKIISFNEIDNQTMNLNQEHVFSLTASGWPKEDLYEKSPMTSPNAVYYGKKKAIERKQNLLNNRIIVLNKSKEHIPSEKKESANSDVDKFVSLNEIENQTMNLKQEHIFSQTASGWPQGDIYEKSLMRNPYAVYYEKKKAVERNQNLLNNKIIVLNKSKEHIPSEKKENANSEVDKFISLNKIENQTINGKQEQDFNPISMKNPMVEYNEKKAIEKKQNLLSNKIIILNKGKEHIPSEKKENANSEVEKNIKLIVLKTPIEGFSPDLLKNEINKKDSIQFEKEKLTINENIKKFKEEDSSQSFDNRNEPMNLFKKTSDEKQDNGKGFFKKIKNKLVASNNSLSDPQTESKTNNPNVTEKSKLENLNFTSSSTDNTSIKISEIKSKFNFSSFMEYIFKIEKKPEFSPIPTETPKNIETTYQQTSTQTRSIGKIIDHKQKGEEEENNSSTKLSNLPKFLKPKLKNPNSNLNATHPQFDVKKNIFENEEKKMKTPMMLNFFNHNDENEDYENDMTNKSEKSPVAGGRKWERFFRKNTKPFLDMNRSVNNLPNSRYLDFFNDLKKEFNDDQFLFAIKNILLNLTNISIAHGEINSTLYVKILNQQMDISSKQNLLSIAEIYYLMPFQIRYPTYSNHFTIFEAIISSLKFFAFEFNIEESLLIQNALLLNHNFYDSYLIQVLFERFTPEDFDDIFSGRKTYKIKYFGNIVNLSKTVLLVFDSYIRYNKNTNGKIPETNVVLIEKAMDSFIKNLNNESILLSDLSGMLIDFSNIFSIFEYEEGVKWERAMNNLILTKINKQLKEFYPGEQASILSEDILNYSNFMTNIKKDFYSEKLLEDVFNKLCELTKSKFNNLEFINILFNPSERSWSYELIATKRIYFNIIQNMMKTSTNTKVYNKSIIEPFLVALEFDLSNGEHLLGGWNSIKSYSNLLVLFGNYNFDEIMKKDTFSPLALDCYFKILSKLDDYILSNMNDFTTYIKKKKKENDLDKKTSNDPQVYEINKDFFTNFFSIQNSEMTIKENLIYEKKETLEENSKFFLSRFKRIPKSMQMYSQFLKEYKYYPNDTVKSSTISYSIIKTFECVLEYMNTLINYKLLNVMHVNVFIDILNEINTPDESSGISIYDSVIKECILSDLELLKKLSTVLNFILFPKNYYDTFGKNFNNETKENQLNSYSLLNYIKSHYDVENYKVETFENLNKNKLSFEEFSQDGVFKSNLIGLYTISDKVSEDELNEFIKSTYSESNEGLMQKMLDDKRYEISHKHFINGVSKTKNADLYTNPDQLGLFNIEEITEKIEMSNLQDQIDRVNLLTTTEHFSIYKILMDLAKISHTIDLNILNKNSLDDFTADIDNFYIKKDTQKINPAFNDFKFGSVRNLSSISYNDVLNSQGYYDYLRGVVNYMINTNEKKTEMKKYKLDKVMGNDAIKYYPISPYFTFYAFSTSKIKSFEMTPKVGEQKDLDWLVILNKKYKNIDVIDPVKQNEISYLKSQYENILIFD